MDRKKKKACDKTKKGMVNSVVKGVSKLSLCKAPSIPTDEHLYQVHDDGSQTTETASTSRSGSLDFSPISPTAVYRGPVMRHAAMPAPSPITSQQRSDPWTRWSEAQFETLRTDFQLDDSENDHDRPYQDTQTKGWDVDAFIEEGEMSDGTPENSHSPLRGDNTMQSVDDPPLSAQTNYAREQLLKSDGYRKQRMMKQKHQAIQSYEEDEDFDYDMDICCDEVEISRGLGGYEDGFGAPTMNRHEYHHLPLAIEEEEHEEWSVASSDSEFGFQTSYSARENVSASETQLSESHTRKSDSACIHCRNGTCENDDCSGSRFMI